MRPPEVTDADVINAGTRIQAAGQRVSGYQLRKTIGRGAPERLMAIWDVHTAGQIDPGAKSICQDLPDDVEIAIAIAIKGQAEAARKMARSLLTAVNSSAARQIKDRDEMIQALSAEHAAEISELSIGKQTAEEKLAESESRNAGHDRDLALLLERDTAQKTAFEALNSKHQALLKSSADHSDASARLTAAMCRIKSLEAELAQLTLTNNAVCDQSNERKMLLVAAEEKIKGLTERNLDLIRSVDAQRIDINRAHQTNKTLEMHGARMLTRIEQLEGVSTPHGVVSNG
ncbi:Alpha-helical coiled-coil protein [Pseudomonas cannabina]|uniref:Alpha-helical coiled-coil protein n=1 Tax=Pseudomonas cannabina TaxID=86840 RepID=A0A3M3K223_PSECA|nr:DNA-binding protein [Pseudomonas cannabina]RMN17158.1 Alpha-helical coiled-coil protein [Pseudomonas cannabina]